LAVRHKRGFGVGKFAVSRWLQVRTEMHGIKIVGNNAIQIGPIAKGIGFFSNQPKLIAAAE